MTLPDLPASQAERDLTELRAALMVALRLEPVTEPGPHGLTIGRPPPDRVLLDEVHRLRRLADSCQDAG